MIFYFAYGSNMHPRTMRERCPGARPHGLARLDGWRFFINRRGAASIWPDPNGVVYGVLWACQLGHFAGLDAFEGVRWHHCGCSSRCLMRMSARLPTLARAT